MGELVRWTEAEFTANEKREFIHAAVMELVGTGSGVWSYVVDYTDDWVVYEIEGTDKPGKYRATYTMAADGAVTFGTPEQVKVEYGPVTEASERHDGRVVEAKGSTAAGGRVFEMQILRYGTSRNGRRYTESVMRRATPLYEGAKAFDHHRTDNEIRTSTVQGLVGAYRNVEARTDGLYGELHLLPTAQHVAEALDASLEAQSAGLPPIIGVSHDVLAKFRLATEGGRRIEEATEIAAVQSVDVVADPSAGGRVTRMVAGGPGDPEPAKESEMDLKQLIALLRDADAAKRAELLKEHAAILEEAGLTADEVVKMFVEAEPAAVEDDPEGEPAEPKVPAAVGATEATRYDRASFMGRRLIRDAMTDAKLDDRLTESVTRGLPEQFTEDELSRYIESVQGLQSELERAGLTPSAPAVVVTKDALDAKQERLDAFFSGDFQKGYKSFKEAFCDFTGANPYAAVIGEDFNRRVMRESIGNPLEMYDSAVRATESADSTTWAKALGDSITRRMVAEYTRPGLDSWRRIVSGNPPINDFRTQRIDRVGGYGTLPTVGEGAPYQPLTTPADEEATYAIAKRGGTEDLTLEVIANDDVRLISRIPQKLGRAAARTLYNFVWDFLVTNVVCTYDGVTLFHATHSNTSAIALSHAALSDRRKAMRRQVGFGDTTDVLSLVPRLLIVPPELEDLATQLVKSNRVAGTGGPVASDQVNLHEGTELLVLDTLSDVNDWFLAADTADVPTIEVGFYQGRETPELFSQTDPTQGAVFNADKITYKIRHIYGGTVIDHRGFQRGTQ